jgi:hypothetical protein
MGTRKWTIVVIASLVGLVAAANPAAGDADSSHAEWIQGTLLLAWGTPGSGAEPLRPLVSSLRQDDGTLTHLLLDEEQIEALGGQVAAYNARIRVLLPTERGAEPVRPQAVQNMGGGGPVVDASGSYPYVSLMCAFSDVPYPSQGLGYFQGMYANSWPALDHYWRKQSYDQVDLLGSGAAGWFDLPHTQGYYVGLINGDDYGPMLSALYNDCTNAAAGSVNLGDYVGINLMFNDTFGCCAWGGWGGVTWEPPWGWRNVGVLGHEMGHAFGLPHSNNADGDNDPYDNPWDVMSDLWHYALDHSTYGTVGKHTISYHKDILGWIPASRKAVVSSEGYYTFDIDHLTLASTTNLHMVQVDIPGSSRFYTVEVRDRVSYDGNLPGFAVIIHEVNTSRSEDAWLVDAEDPGNGADAGARWMPGECFDDPANEITICVQSITTEGFRVTVGYGDWGGIFSDGFESGDLSAWGAGTD